MSYNLVVSFKRGVRHYDYTAISTQCLILQLKFARIELLYKIQKGLMLTEISGLGKLLYKNCEVTCIVIGHF